MLNLLSNKQSVNLNLNSRPTEGGPHDCLPRLEIVFVLFGKWSSPSWRSGRTLHFNAFPCSSLSIKEQFNSHLHTDGYVWVDLCPHAGWLGAVPHTALGSAVTVGLMASADDFLFLFFFFCICTDCRASCFPCTLTCTSHTGSYSPLMPRKFRPRAGNAIKFNISYK